VFPHAREVTGEKNRIENLGEKVYISLGKILQDHFLDTILARRFPELENPDGPLKLVTVC
jgi:hypothetical protein